MAEFEQNKLPGIIGVPLEWFHRGLGRILYGAQEAEVYPYTRYETRRKLNQWGSYDYPLVEAARVIGPDHEYRIERGFRGSIDYILQRRSK